MLAQLMCPQQCQASTFHRRQGSVQIKSRSGGRLAPHLAARWPTRQRWRCRAATHASAAPAAGDDARQAADASAQVASVMEDAYSEAEEAVAGEDSAAVAPGVQEVQVQQTPSSPVEQARELWGSSRLFRGGAVAAAVFLVGTFAIAVGRVVARANSPTAKRKRTVNSNKLAVESINELFAQGREAATPGALRRIRSATGFSGVELFRKYLWFLLRERPFNVDAVADMVALKSALALSDEEVADAIRERAQRIYDRYGTVMLDTQGMSKAGVERKATCRALFSKLLFLQECEELLPQSSEAAERASIRDVFGATEDDAAKLRIASLYEVDLERLGNLPAVGEEEQ